MLKWFIGVLLALPMIMGMEPAKASERVLLAPPPTAKSAASSTSFAKETTPGTIRNLREQIGRAKDGRVRVIVGYRVPFAPEARLNPQERAQQQKEIAAAGKSLRRAFAAADKRGKGISAFDSIPFAAMEVTQKELDRLLADPNVLTIAADEEMTPLLTHSVPLIGAPVAWQAGASGAGQTVAVIDHGTQTDHPFLRDAQGKSKTVYEAVCVSPGGCIAGTGRAVMQTSTQSAWHGTAVAGIIAGNRPATAGRPALTGVVPDANLIVIRTWYISEVLLGLQKIYDLRHQFNIAAVNISLGMAQAPGSCDFRNPAMKAVIDNLRASGTATVAAAGNDSDKTSAGWTGATDRIMFPACISSVVSVGAVYSSTTGQIYPCTVRQRVTQDEVACFSDTAPGLSLLAPSFPTESSGLNGSYTSFSGTSAAAPHVAAAFAALRSKVPNATVSQMLEALRATGKPVRDYRTGLVTPRIQIDKALEHLLKTAQPSIDYIARGDGSGTVSFAPSGSLTTCSKDCTNAYPAGTRVTMTARPQPGMRFEGWSGAGSSCGRADTCALTVSNAVKVQANFMNPDAPVKLDYSASGSGSGTIRVHGAGSASETCSAAACSFNYPRGTEVRVNVRADAGSTLTSLTHGQSGASTRFACTDGWCSVTLSQNTQVQATFARSPAPKPSFTLSYSRGGTGTGTLSASVGGQPVVCAGASCSTRQPEGTLVTLSAAASGNSNFSGWSGACSGSAPTCTLTLRADASVVGTFQPRPGNNNVTLSYLRTGSGTISASVDGTSTTCAASCTITRPSGTLVTLTAQPGPGAVFAGWSGSCRGTAPTCTLNLRAGGVALATFQNRPRTTASSQ
ncbi:S8 family serine peptidase [Aestuariivirga sp.]|uniref:S8 family serine peptidase n=1 Tax=Aestuariivirga sp. TaxID=2650926 RepID=UPI0037851901